MCDTIENGSVWTFFNEYIPDFKMLALYCYISRLDLFSNLAVAGCWLVLYSKPFLRALVVPNSVTIDIGK
jgi:hypothetical protein